MITGALVAKFKVRVSFPEPKILVAPIVMVKIPRTDGTPVIIPLTGSKLKPAGNGPEVYPEGSLVAVIV